MTKGKRSSRSASTRSRSLAQSASRADRPLITTVIFDLDDTLYDCLGQRVHAAHFRAAEAMAAAGCSYVDLGAESFDQKVLDAVGKNMRAEATEHAVRILKRHGIAVELNILLGATPVDSEASIARTLTELERLDVDYALFSIANPFPGTDFYQAAKANGWLAYGDYIPVDPAKNAIISYPHLSQRRLEELARRAYRRHYLRPKALYRELRKIRSPADLRDKLVAGLRLVRRTLDTP